MGFGLIPKPGGKRFVAFVGFCKPLCLDSEAAGAEFEQEQTERIEALAWLELREGNDPSSVAALRRVEGNEGGRSLDSRAEGQTLRCLR
jgi:hypothetical protein